MSEESGELDDLSNTRFVEIRPMNNESRILQVTFEELMNDPQTQYHSLKRAKTLAYDIINGFIEPFNAKENDISGKTLYVNIHYIPHNFKWILSIDTDLNDVLKLFETTFVDASVTLLTCDNIHRIFVSDPINQ
jgi:hypothetical protein